MRRLPNIRIKNQIDRLIDKKKILVGISVSTQN
jgi:hypothetical protein